MADFYLQIGFLEVLLDLIFGGAKASIIALSREYGPFRCRQSLLQVTYPKMEPDKGIYL